MTWLQYFIVLIGNVSTLITKVPMLL